LLYVSARGKFTYTVPPPETPDTIPPMTRGTVFDMASCTKVVAGTTAAALLYQKGLLDLYAPVYKYIPGFDANGKHDVTVLHLLLHNSGLPADPSPGYETELFGCPETAKYHPEEAFTCRDKCYAQLLGQRLSREVGAKYVYSDMSLMAIMNVIGRIVRDAKLVTVADIRQDCPLSGDGWPQCYYEAYVRKHIFDTLGLSKATGYLPPRETWKNIAPTENETHYRHRVIQG
jgi:CubicO group peptidase (beta-lactamase class C family)